MNEFIPSRETGNAVESFLAEAFADVPDNMPPKCFIAYGCIRCNSFEKRQVIATVLERQGAYAFVLLNGKRLANGSFLNVRAKVALPIDSNFKSYKSISDVAKTKKYYVGINGLQFDVGFAVSLNLQFLSEDTWQLFMKHLKVVEERAVADVGMVFTDHSWLSVICDSVLEETISEVSYSASESTSVEHILNFYQILKHTGETSTFSMLVRASIEYLNPLCLIDHDLRETRKSLYMLRQRRRQSLYNDDKENLSPGRVVVNLPQIDFETLSSLPNDVCCSDFIMQKLQDRRNEYSGWQPLICFLTTYNLEGIIEIESMDVNALLNFNDQQQPDICVLGIQFSHNQTNSNYIIEIFMQKIEKSDSFQAINYSRVKCTSHDNMRIMVYCRSTLMEHVKLEEAMSVSSSFALEGFGASKSSPYTKILAFRFAIYNTSFCFVNLLLPQTDVEVSMRNKALTKAIRKIKFPTVTGDRMTMAEHDIVFVFGSLNYRLYSSNPSNLQSIFYKNKYKQLFQFDTLTAEIPHLKALNNISEAAVKHSPTTPYIVGKDVIDVLESDLPYYGDRILYFPNHCEPLSYNIKESFKYSSHRPLVGVFKLGARIIRDELLQETFEAIVYQTDIILNLSKPQLNIKNNIIDFGTIGFLDRSTITLDLKNTSLVPGTFNLTCMDENCVVVDIPEWLIIEQVFGTISPGEELSINLEAKTDSSNIVAMQMSDEILNNFYICISMKEGNVYFVAVECKFNRTSFGLPLSIVCNLEIPIREVSDEELKLKLKAFHNEQSGENSRGLFGISSIYQVPKELVRLADVISKNYMDEPNIFRKVGALNEMKKLINALDTTPMSQALPEVSAHSVCDTIKCYLSSLPSPVIHNAALEMSPNLSESTFPDNVKIVKGLKFHEKNTFNYMINFLKNLLQHNETNCSTADDFAVMFSTILMRDSDGVRSVSRDAKARFLKTFFENDTKMLFQ